MHADELGLDLLRLLSVHPMRRILQRLLEMPDLHLLGELLRVELLVKLHELEREKVHVRKKPLPLHLLLVELAQICHDWEAAKSLLALLWDNLGARVDHVKSLFQMVVVDHHLRT